MMSQAWICRRPSPYPLPVFEVGSPTIFFYQKFLEKIFIHLANFLLSTFSLPPPFFNKMPNKYK